MNDRTIEVIGEYVRANTVTGRQHSAGIYDLSKRPNTYSPNDQYIEQVRIQDHDGNPTDVIAMGRTMRIDIWLSGVAKRRGAAVGVIFKTGMGQWVTSITTEMTCEYIQIPRSFREIAVLTIPRTPFTPGQYWIDLSVAQPGVGRLDYVKNAAQFNVLEADVYGTGHQVSSHFGLVYLDGSWQIHALDTLTQHQLPDE